MDLKTKIKIAQLNIANARLELYNIMHKLDFLENKHGLTTEDIKTLENAREILFKLDENLEFEKE